MNEVDVTNPGDGELTEEQLLAIIQDENGSSDEIPPEVLDLDKGNKDAQGKASHAYRKLKEKLRASNQLLALREKKDKDRAPAAPSAPPAPPPGADAARLVIRRIKDLALQNLGLSDESQAPELVQMEMQRIYGAQAYLVDQRRQAASKAAEVVDSTLKSLTRLTDADRVEIKRRLGGLDVLQQTNADVIRGVASQYLGEKLLSGGDVQNPDPEGDQEPPEDRGSAAAGTSGVRTQGRQVVRPGEGQKTSNRINPPTRDEMEQMRKLGFTDLRAYREAVQIKDKYRSR